MAKSIREQLAAAETALVKAQENVTKITNQIAELKVQAENEVDPALIVAGNTVVFDYGKGESVRELTGLVLAIKAADPAQPKSAPQARVAVGEGFEADVKTIYFAQVKKVFPAVEATNDPVPA